MSFLSMRSTALVGLLFGMMTVPALAMPTAGERSFAKPGNDAIAIDELGTQEALKTPAQQARAFNRTPLTEPLKALADRHDLTLVYEAGAVRLPGVLTLMLGDDLSEDVELLQRALGPSIPLQITEYQAEKQLIVMPGPAHSFTSLPFRPIEEKRSFFALLFGSDEPTPVRQAPELPEPAFEAAVAETAVEPPKAEALAEIEPIEVPDVVPVESVLTNLPKPPVAPKPETIEPEPAPAPVAELAPGAEPVAPPRMLALEMDRGERLSDALEELLKSEGWTLVWRATLDLEAATPARVEGLSLTEILEQVLPQLGLAADLYTPSRTAVIRNVAPAATEGAP